MKPLIKTTGMRDGSLNEEQVIRSIPTFIDTFNSIAESRDRNARIRIPVRNDFRVEYVTSVGLVRQPGFPMLATSADGLCFVRNSLMDHEIYAIEVKTMTSPDTIEAAQAVREKHGRLFCINNIGGNEESDHLFRSVVKTTGYRSQCIHHASVFKITKVLYVVAKGGSAGHGEILYIVRLQFNNSVIEAHVSLLQAIHSFSFFWVGGDAEHIPDAYEEYLKGEHCSDLQSFKSYYALSMAVERLIIAQGSPLPPCRMIRPKAIVYWNVVKGGVDVFSRNMLSFARVNTAENPIISVLSRLLSTKIANAALVYRIYEARASGALPRFSEAERYGYTAMRKSVSRICSAKYFVRRLAEEWLREEGKLQRGSNNEEEDDDDEMSEQAAPRGRNMVEKFNKGAKKTLRLSPRSTHMRCQSKKRYCVLCAWTKNVVVNGKKTVLRGGKQCRKECKVCGVNLCEDCFTIWHSNGRLVRRTPSRAEVREVLRRMENRRKQTAAEGLVTLTES